MLKIKMKFVCDFPRCETEEEHWITPDFLDGIVKINLDWLPADWWASKRRDGLEILCPECSKL